eukprot:TRINITY_DN10821_c0_g1_i2.p1 TRINITY_DN10821_c0_g1~~TRINITY_DN10821_c0_g1_i2.p1  ORF type:complete len:197 (+),score=60.44 TRINITY_DN10821_c0_g1_i2:69-659(+)
MSAAAVATPVSMEINHDVVVGMDGQLQVCAASADVVHAPSVQLMEPIASPPFSSVAVMEQQPVVRMYVQPTYVQPGYSYAAPQPYTSYDALPFVPGEEQPIITLVAGMRVVYTSRSNSQKYAGTVLQRTPAGWLLKLDVDSGVKEVEDVEVWRLQYETSDVVEEEHNSSQEKALKSGPVKSKKAAKKVSNKKKGCC